MRAAAHFRQEAGARVWPVILSAPVLMPDFWQFPTVSMGLGPYGDFSGTLHALPGASRLVKPSDQKCGLLGDGEMTSPNPMATPSGARGLDNLFSSSTATCSASMAGARQRQDHPGARGRLSRRRLETSSRCCGVALDPLLARDHQACCAG